jgi:Na+-transporting NADH:ubiquinone oxidoreductase subunit F
MSVKVTIKDTKQVNAEVGEFLREALLANGIDIGICGGNGHCGRCKVKTDSSSPVTAEEREYFSAEELSAGWRLACQVLLKEDTSVELDPSFEPVGKFSAKCEKITKLTDDINLFSFALTGNNKLHFVPGQYIVLTAPVFEESTEPVQRAFSLASSSLDEHHFNLLIRKNPNGICTNYLFNFLQLDEELAFRGPIGDFALTSSDKPAIMVAGGSGLSAIRSLLFQLKSRRDERKTFLFFGAQTEQQLYLIDELKQLETDLPNFKFIPVVQNPSSSWKGERGLVTDAVHRYFDSLSDTEAFLCGSPGMLKACLDVLKKFGLTDSNIHFDAFGKMET